MARTICTRYPDLKAYFASDRRWKEKYYQNIFDAIGCGMAYLANMVKIAIVRFINPMKYILCVQTIR